jgi:hypothetical protein
MILETNLKPSQGREGSDFTSVVVEEVGAGAGAGDEGAWW